MTHDEMIAVIQAHKDGEGIECRPRSQSTGPWRPIAAPGWDFPDCNYRVRRIPRVVNIRDESTGELMSNFKPTLAATCDDITQLVFPVVASPKLDGIRCIIKGGVALSRSLKPIRNVLVQEWAAAHAAQLEGLDGELISGRHDAEVFNRTTRVVMSADGGDDWAFWVFDRHDPSLPYRERLRAVRGVAEGLPQVRNIPSRQCHDIESLATFETRCLELGFEGVMVRSPNAPYKLGRSTVKEGYLLKIKQFADDEATVIGFVERQHNKNVATTDALGHTERSTAAAGMVPAGDLGTILCRRPDGVEFGVGSGFTAQQRIDLWAKRDQLLGKLLTYKHFPQGVKDAPRFPTFKGFRDGDDL